MTEPTTPQSEQKLKTLIIQGIIGAIALAGTTAIPLLVKQALEQPTAPIAAPTIEPATAATPVASPAAAQAETSATLVDTPENGNGKDKPKKVKD